MIADLSLETVATHPMVAWNAEASGQHQRFGVAWLCR